MLNELYQAALALEMAGVKQGQEWHKHMSPFPKVKTIRLWLAKDGSIVNRVDVLDESTVAVLRKYMPTKFFSVPAMNINYLGGYEGEKDHTEEERRKDVAGEIDKVIKGLRLLRKQSCELKKLFSLGIDSLWGELFRRLSEIDPIGFREQFEKVLSGNTVGFSPTANKSIHVVLDIEDYERFGSFPIAHPENIRVLNDFLLTCEKQNDESNFEFESGVLDIFGNPQSGANELITEVTVPVLGLISVFSLNKDIPAQERYNLSSVETCKLGKLSRKRIRRSLEWLTQSERRGLTWGMLEGKSLMLAFAVELPQREIPLTGMFGAQVVAEEIDSELSFEKQAESVVSLLKGNGGAGKSKVSLVILRKMDSKRVKVICDQIVSVESLEEHSNSWSQGFANIPSVAVREWPFVKKCKHEDGDNRPQDVTPKSILPLRLHRTLNEVYKQSGESVISFPGYSVADDASLFLGVDNMGLAAGMMVQYIRCSRGYFLALCRELCTKDDKGFRIVTRMRCPGEHLGVLGLLLKKLNINKEEYMKGIPYNLGRFLRVADELHSLYCELVRKNDIPNEFCGSSLLLATMENPESALQQLAMRSNPYVKWSQTFNGEKAALVRYWRRHWSEIADQLAMADLPKHLSAAEQAQLFLGFLSSFPKAENFKAEKDNNETAKEKQ